MDSQLLGSECGSSMPRYLRLFTRSVTASKPDMKKLPTAMSASGTARHLPKAEQHVRWCGGMEDFGDGTFV